MFAWIRSSGTCCYFWLQIGWDYIFVNEAHVSLFKEKQSFFFFFVLLPWCLWWLLSRASLVKHNFWPVANVVLAPTSAHPFCSASSSHCPWAQKKVHCAGREQVKRSLVLVSAMCCIWNTHLPPGFASGAGFLLRLCWAGVGFGWVLWLAQVEALWTPGWLELPNSNPSITGRSKPEHNVTENIWLVQSCKKNTSKLYLNIYNPAASLLFWLRCCDFYLYLWLFIELCPLNALYCFKIITLSNCSFKISMVFSFCIVSPELCLIVKLEPSSRTSASSNGV